MITELINKQDNFELIRDQVAAILALEIDSQMGLALAAGLNVDDWKVRVFSERSNAFEEFLNAPSDTSPIANVCLIIRRLSLLLVMWWSVRKAQDFFNIDCYGYGLARNNPNGGHIPGDQEAAFESNKAARLVRNILMASSYTYLMMRGVVWHRWIDAINVFQPEPDTTSLERIVASRVLLKVDFNEFSPQYVPQELELLTVDVNRLSNGELIVESDYDFS